MAMTDPIADMLTRIRNANQALLERLDIPASRFKVELAKVLKAEGYIRAYRLIDDQKQGQRAGYPWDQASQSAGPAGISQGPEGSQDGGGIGSGGGLHLAGPHDREDRAGARPGRRGAVLRVVIRMAPCNGRVGVDLPDAGAASAER